MPDTKDLLSRLDRADAPDVWPDAASRSPQRVPEPDPSHGRRGSRMAAGTLAFVVSVATIAVLVVAFRPDRTVEPGLPSPRVTGAPSGTAPRTFDGWTISVSVTPTQVGSLAFSVRPVEDASPRGVGSGWVKHAFVVTNTGTHVIHLTDRGASAFLGPDRGLIAASGGCGFGYKGAVTDVGVCLTSLTGRTLEPGESQSQNISLFEGLPGMSPLVAGTYVFQQPFSYTGADGRGIHALSLAITYTITEDGKSPAGCPDAASREAVQLPGGAPFLNATKFGSIAEAQAASERALSLPRPNDPLASDEQVSDVWVAQMAGQPQIRIDYASCIYVEIEVARSELAASKGAAAKLYRRMAAEDAPSTDGKSRAIEVLGVPAYLIPTDSAVFANGQSQHAGGSIELIVDGQTVDIVGHVSNEALFRLASSVITNGS